MSSYLVGSSMVGSKKVSQLGGPSTGASSISLGAIALWDETVDGAS
jgi:hypothetical protein